MVDAGVLARAQLPGVSVLIGRRLDLGGLAPGPELLIPAATVLVANYGFDARLVEAEVTELQLFLCLALYAAHQWRLRKLGDRSAP